MPDTTYPHEVLDDDAALATRAFEVLTEAAREAIAARGKFSLALTGGSGPRGLYQRLAKEPGSVDWANTFVFLGDERFVPYDAKDSNFGMCKTLLLDHVPVPAENVLPIPTDTGTKEEAAVDYAATLTRVLTPAAGQPPVLDLVLLGMGDDGHCASLFPGKPTLEISDVWTTGSTPGTLPPPVGRVTVTFPVLNAARNVLFLVPGQSKAKAVRDIFEGNPPKEVHPSAAVQPTDGTLLWLLDKPAASLLTR